MAELAPPKVDVEDPGAHELDEHDHLKTSNIPIPHGHNENNPGGLPIPRTVVDKVEPENPSHGEVPGTEAFDIRTQDAEPDEVRTAPDITRAQFNGELRGDNETDEEVREGVIDGSVESRRRDDNEEEQDGVTSDAQEEEDEDDARPEKAEEAEDNDDFDDFDDFAEGDEHDDNDFGDFDEADNDTSEDAIPDPVPHTPSNQSAKANLPRIFDYTGLDTREDLEAALQPYISTIFSKFQSADDAPSIDTSDINPSFLTERSQSLWAQLVAPPPLQPPDWIRSRIRRLFLVSLGVPVDLDEILPASKQKKLVLPSVHIEERAALRPNDAAASGLVSRIKEEDAAASGGISQPAAPKASIPGQELDLNTARLLCSTTDVAMRGFTDAELQEHFTRLREFMEQSGRMLQFWTRQRDSAEGDKKAFEEVIENLVKHAQKIRK